MYPGDYNIGWLGYKGDEPVEETQKVGSVARAWQWRESGINPPNQPPNKTVLENIAEDILVQKPLQITSCDLPGYPRSTFLMVFSPDGTKLASTHGNHNIYVSELASGKHVRILRGHPRTPWCIAFHPSHPQLIGSGCLGGQVRVWDIASGGSEVWNVYNETVIASIAFHPREQLLVIATYNELYFWDWSHPAPFTKVSTRNINEKVRYVAFDSLGFKLITGISLWACSSNANSTPLVTVNGPPGSGNSNSGNNSNPGNNGGPGNNRGPGTGNNPRGDNPRGDGPPRGDDGSPARPPDTPGAAQDMIVNSYQTLVQRYDSLVRNYQRLFMVRHRLINTPPLANTIDRGTDPMETYPPETGRHRRRSSRRSPRSTASSTAQTDTASPTPGTSRQQDTAARDAAAAAQLSSELLQLGGFSIGPVAVRSADSSLSGLLGAPVFRSVASAFQPLSDERTTRLMPNPFSSTNCPQQPNSSRTRGRGGPESALSALRQFSIRRRNLDAAENAAREMQAAAAAVARDTGDTSMTSAPSTLASNPTQSTPAHSPPPYVPPPLPTEPPPSRPPPPPEPTPGTSSTQTSSNNSSTQMSTDPADPDGEANTINESLDLIRDILRDSGTRLLNLITNMSMNILSNSERDESARVPVHVFTGNLRRDFMASSSDSENEHTEVNITRTPNTTFREAEAGTSTDQPPTTRPTVNSNQPQNTAIPQISNRMTFELETPNQVPLAPSRAGAINISDRMTFELGETAREGPSREGGINVSLSNDRFRVRTQSNWSVTPGDPNLVTSTSPDTTSSPGAGASATSGPGSSNISGPSTSTDPRPSTSTNPGPSTAAEPGVSTSAAAEEPQAGPSTAPDSTLDPNVPSTSRDNFWSRGPSLPAAEAIRRVQLGVTALQKHTLQLANMWLRGDRTTLRELRTMWEDLRRRIMALHREAGGRADTPSFYTRSLLERCMILTELTEMTDLSARQLGRPRRTRDANQAARSGEEGNSSTSSNPSASRNAAAEPSTSAEGTSDSRNSRAARSHRIQRNKRLVRLQQAYRWRAEDEVRRRERNSPILRISHPRTRHRSNLMRTVEQNATRHVIRTRAMKVLSVMFNMMMMCLEERGLSQLIINMLKTLKKALALTCFMMMSNRNMPRGGGGATPAAAQSVASADVVRIQNVEHSGPVNVEDGYDPHSLRVVRYDGEREVFHTNARKQPQTKPQTAATSSTQTTPIEELPPPIPLSSSQSWSHRLAVQIAAANRNNSSTANTRRDMYIETRRQKALHRTNPTAHPFIRRRFPPVMSHRIPAMRSMPPSRLPRTRPRSTPPMSDASAGPSSAPDQPSDPPRQPHEDRDNFIRLAHIRLRTAARNRFRRLQTIRLYTPSSVREMFALQDYQQENRAEPNGNGPEVPLGEDEMIPFAASLPVFRNREQFHAMLASDGVLPVLHVNELQPVSGADHAPPPPTQAGQPRTLPRIHEYLQPIILAQNAMVVEDSDGAFGPGLAAGVHGNRRLGGMAGLLDAGIISEALPAPSHRVQAWDFTSGAVPDIGDNIRNVVVQRCRIHNDASIDISKDGRLLVALLPVPRLRNTNNWLGVYSLEWPRLGQCLHTAVLEQSAVSVALSPTARYLAVGLGSRRFTSSHSRTNIIALLYKLDPLESSSRDSLSPMKELEQYWEHGFTSLNCLRWAPQPGQGLVYANNTGQLIIMS